MPVSRRPTRRFLSEGLPPRRGQGTLSARSAVAWPRRSAGRADLRRGLLLPNWPSASRARSTREAPAAGADPAPAPRRLRQHPSRTGRLRYNPIGINCQDFSRTGVTYPSFRRAPEARTRNPLASATRVPSRGFRVLRGVYHRAGRRPDPLAQPRDDRFRDGVIDRKRDQFRLKRNGTEIVSCCCGISSGAGGKDEPGEAVASAA